jgi:hypothetical protein
MARCDHQPIDRGPPDVTTAEHPVVGVYLIEAHSKGTALKELYEMEPSLFAPVLVIFWCVEMLDPHAKVSLPAPYL